MKKIFYRFMLLYTITSISSTVVGQVREYRTVGSELPDLRLVSRSGVSYTKDDVTEDRNFFLVMFNPTCGHCVEFATSIMQHRPLFEENTVFMMAAADMLEHFAPFVAQSGWQDGGELIIGVDSAAAIQQIYNYTTLPQVNVYDKDKKLIKTFGALNSIDSLRRYIY